MPSVLVEWTLLQNNNERQYLVAAVRIQLQHLFMMGSSI
jgi:hypothetical protein